MTAQSGIQLPEGVQLEKKYTNECQECGDEFLTVYKETIYCGNCATTALVIMHYKQMLANRWKIVIPENRKYIKEVMSAAQNLQLQRPIN